MFRIEIDNSPKTIQTAEGCHHIDDIFTCVLYKNQSCATAATKTAHTSSLIVSSKKKNEEKCLFLPYHDNFYMHNRLYQ